MPTQPRLPLNAHSHKLPWAPGTVPLMLAPMQGVTNAAVRALFTDSPGGPDVVFTEFMRVRPSASGPRLSATDVRDAKSSTGSTPLVVQLIGRERAPLVEAAEAATRAGTVHLNLNLGCPFGRMTAGSGGALLQRPELLEDILPALRATTPGSFSVKVRAGYSDPEQVFSLLPLFESAGVDFLVLHPRTVVQEYTGEADHRVTARVVESTKLPVIANGDIRTAAKGSQVLKETGAAGLMIGRGGLADPLLFQRLHGLAPADDTQQERVSLLRGWLAALLDRYSVLFCGDAQVLAKTRSLLVLIEEQLPWLSLRKLHRAKSLAAFREALESLE